MQSLNQIAPFTSMGPDPKADFFIELYPVLTDRVLSKGHISREHVIDRMLEKYAGRKSGMRSITDFRKIKAYVAIARAAGQEQLIISRYIKFVDDDDYDISDLEIDTARVHKQAVAISRDAHKLRTALDELVIGEYLGEEELWAELEKLANMILSKVKHADRRRSA